MPKPYNPHDKWTKRARREGFRARSVYKLQELDEKFHLFGSGLKVLDIGSAPGSWLQYISKQIGPRGKVLGLDLQEIKFVSPNVVTRVCDISKMDSVNESLASVGWTKADVVTSDIMSNATGIKDLDQWHSIELTRHVFEIAKLFLKPNGFLVMKVFQGEGFPELIKNLKDYFPTVKVTKVRASRDRSREVYVICRGRRNSLNQ